MAGYIDPFVGTQLKQRRENHQLTIDDIAAKLRLNKEYITAIEESNFTKLPHTYLKGYVRAYAKLLAVAEEDINIYLMNTNKSTSLKGWKVFTSRKQISASNRLVQWITVAIFSTLIVLAALWWKTDSVLTNLSSDTLPQHIMAQNEI